MAKKPHDDDDDDRSAAASAATAVTMPDAAKKAEQEAQQKRSKSVKAGLENLRAVVFLPITDDSEGKKNAKTIRDAIDKLETALALPK